ncbi:hypothetical protein NX784_11010 [Massilia pinisoli]|uniref:DUF3192 domain-containing protein n=1 Tax=Massilia pinisoli TaxID=1772194 RepID=A0ABT1ZQF4_9BURK|nr:hypothetical protein [Massilia pinisoli]MCS0582121.1 hypothetical protein [Massilia pinisoli]
MNVSMLTRLRWSYWRLPLYGRLAVLTVAGVGISGLLRLTEVPAEDNRPPNPAGHVDQPAYDPVAKWGQSKAAAAKEVMAMVQQDSKIYEEGSHLVVEMKIYIESPDQRLQYIRTIADTDMILHGTPRNIYFYDPANRKIGQADTLNGVRLID